MPRAALELPDALRAGATSPASSAGSPAPLQAPRGPPPGFPPLWPARDFTYVYTRRPREPPAAPAAAPAASAAAPAAPAGTAALLPKGAVAVPPVANQHSMGTRSKSGYRMPAIYHAVPLSPMPKTFRSALADPNWRKNTVLSCRITPGILCPVLLGPMLSLGSGSSSTSFSLMAPSSGTRHVGFFVALPSGLVWILMRPSALW